MNHADTKGANICQWLLKNWSIMDFVDYGQKLFENYFSKNGRNIVEMKENPEIVST